MSESPSVTERVAAVLDAREETVALAESCTGGLVGSLLTDVPGASTYFDRAYVTYTHGAKRDVLGVDPEALETEGAVSERVGREMAAAAREQAGTTWGLSTTGVAGPARPPSGTPVGTVYVGVAGPGESASDPGSADPAVSVEGHQLDGGRAEIKARAARQALVALLARLEA